MLSIFSCACWPSAFFLWRNVYLGLLPTFDSVVVSSILSCMSHLYLLEIKPSSVASFANIFSHSKDCLFILFIVSFAVKKLLSLIRSHLFFFNFHYSRRWVKKILLRFMSKNVLPMFSSKSFIVSGM